MKSCTVRISSDRIVYELELKAKVNILSGDSGTGKSSMMKMLEEWKRIKTCGVSVNVTGDYRKVLYTNTDNFSGHAKYDDDGEYIIFLEPDSEFVNSRELLKSILESESRFVIITRCTLPKQLEAEPCKLRTVEVLGKEFMGC